ncbi:MAG: Calx-beta domain-containing protein [Pirellulales bacterium]
MPFFARRAFQTVGRRGQQPTAHRPRLLLQRLENRVLMAGDLSISDATVIEGSDELKFIDRFVSERSGGLARPRGLTFGPDVNSDGVSELYVTGIRGDEMEILRYDGQTGAFLNVFVPAGSGGLIDVIDFVFTPDGSLYVTSFLGNNVLRYDGITGAYLDTVASGLSGPAGLTVGDDGSLFVTCSSNEVLRYNATGIAVFVAAGSGGLDGALKAVFGPDGNQDGAKDLYVSSQNNQQILRYDGRTGAFLDVFATDSAVAGPKWLSLGPDGFLYTTVRRGTSGLDWSIVRFDAATGAFVDSFPLRRDGWFLSIGPDGLVYNSSLSSGNFVERFGHSSLAVFTVTLSEPSAAPVTVAYTISNGSATEGTDYAAAFGTLTFAPGQTTRTILVKTLDDAIAEPSETFTVNLSNAVGATILDGQGVATIQDSDPAGPTLSINDITVAEEGPHAAFTVRLNPPLNTPVRVDYATADQTAQAGLDYVATTGSVTFAPGQTIQTIVVPVINDATLEDPDETFSVQLSNPQGATIGDGEAIALVEGNDSTWTLRASKDGQSLEVYFGNPPFPGQDPLTWPMTSKEPLPYFDDDGGDDSIFVELPAGSEGPDGGILFIAGAGLNELHVKSGRVRIDSLSTGVLNTTVDAGAELITAQLEQDALNLNGDGRVTLLPDSNVSRLTSLTLGPEAVLDLADNALVVDYTGASPLAAIRERVFSGRGGPGFGANWTRPGINSSTASEANKVDPEGYSIGYAENATLPLGLYTNFRGQPVDDTSILIAYTPTGDANLDGLVDDNDVTVVSATFARGVPQPNWALGDFDYNGFVDDDDMTLLGALYDPAAALVSQAAPATVAISLREMSPLAEREVYDAPAEAPLFDMRSYVLAIQQLLAAQDDAFSSKRNRSEALVLN